MVIIPLSVCFPDQFHAFGGSLSDSARSHIDLVIDVAVIGGGPAGAAAAIAASRAGLRAVLLERNAVCGDGPAESVGPACTSLLEALGIDATAMATPFAGFMVLGEIAPFAAAGLHVDRGPFDQALRESAARAGAEICLGCCVRNLARRDFSFQLETTSGTLAARTLIDASGRSIWLARRLALARRRLSPPLIAWRDILAGEPQRTGAFARFFPHPDGWTWLAEVNEHRVVRVRLTSSRRRLIGAEPHPAAWQCLRQLAGDGWFLAGEAAAALDPAAGSGIEFALRSGLAAGRAAVATAEGQPASLIAARYHDALTREWEGQAATLAHHYRRLGIAPWAELRAAVASPPLDTA